MKSSTPSGGKILFIFILFLGLLGGILYFFWPDQVGMKWGEIILPDSEQTALSTTTVENHAQVLAPTVATAYDDVEMLKTEIEQHVADSEKFLLECEALMDQELEDFVALAPEEVLANESLAREKFSKFLKIQTLNRPLSKIYSLAQPNAQLLSDDYIIEKSAQLRPCRPFMVAELWSRLIEGLVQGKWSEEFQREIKSSLFPYLIEALSLENRVFSLGLYVNLLEKMAKGKLVPAESEVELKRIEEQVAEFGEIMRAQLENVGKDDEIKGAAELLSQDISEARKIKEDLIQIVRDSSSQ